MIDIHLDISNDYFYMDIRGHANQAEHGKDIVCAAVSVLAQSFVLYVQEMEADAEVDIETLEVSPGLIRIEGRGEVGDAFSMLHIGLWAIHNEYPDYVEISGEKRPEEIN